VTPQETSPAYDAYPTCLDCTFIGEQLIIYEYEPVFVGHRFRRERVNPGASQPHPTPAIALALGPQSRSTVAPPSVARESRFAPPRHAPGPVSIEPRARQRPALASAQTAGPRTHVRYTRFSAPAPAPERSGVSGVAIALPAGVAPAPLARAGLAIARPDVSGRAGLRSDFPAQTRAPVRSRSAAVARAAEGVSQSASHGVAIPREAWGGVSVARRHDATTVRRR
jgi:hypothetical protein